MKYYGYFAVFGLMALEGSSLPVPSEVVMPFAGFLSAKGLLSFPLALLAGLLGSIVGLAVDYYIAYFLGKEIIYKHLHKFHISKKSLDSFDRWFKKNGDGIIFVSRLLPVVRTIMSFPAGFAKMDQKKFFLYSFFGTFIWDAVLMLFGFYALSASSRYIILGAISTFAVILYVLYKITMTRVK
ncbi:MAG: DedA family protein [Candidatus Micrarchaeaceae archaeon]